MLSYSLKCKRNTESFNPVVSKISNDKIMISSQCDVCGSKKSRFIKNKKQKEY